MRRQDSHNRMLSIIIVALLTGLSWGLDTGKHPEWPRWCGKAYQPQYPSFNPGGQTVEPSALPNGPALHLQLKPRYSLYLESESEGEFIVNAAVSEWFGQPWPGLSHPETAPPVVFTINLVANNDVLISRNVSIGTEGNLFKFNFARAHLKPRLQPYKVVLFGATTNGAPNVTASSEFFYLPEKNTGSVTKLDNLNGGMLFRNKATGGKFEPLLPYGFYASCDGFLCDKDNIDKIKEYADLGLNGMVALTPISNSRPAFEYMDTLDIHYMYDLRGYFMNLTSVRDQVTAIKDFENLYSYWGADEPDGWQYPFNSTVMASTLIRSIDPYHPVTVTLNCQNYYFKEYSEGFDFIMEDVYPIAINSTFSKWGTECTATRGDCGCDMCSGNVQDVSNRLDALAQYEKWLGIWPKTKVHNPQSFHGEDYWFRDPTIAEEVAMNALAFNHHAKSILSWVWPTSDSLAQIMGKFASVVAKAPVRDFIVLGKANQIKLKGHDVIDAAYWISGNQLLLNVVNGGYEPVMKSFKIPLPETFKSASIETVLWGNGTWSVANNEVRLGPVEAMSTNMMILHM